MFLTKPTALIALSLMLLNTNANAGFFDNLADNLKSGNLEGLITDAVTDVAKEVAKGVEKQESNNFSEVEDEDEDQNFQNTNTNVDKNNNLNIDQNKDTVVKFSKLKASPKIEAAKSSFMGWVTGANDDIPQYKKYLNRYLNGKLFTGKAIRVWEDGGKEEINYVNGNVEGLREVWWPNGNLKVRYFYKPGWYDKGYTEEGFAKREEWYKDGSKRHDNMWDPRTNTEVGTKHYPSKGWYKNGIQKSEMGSRFKGDNYYEKHWHENGKKSHFMTVKSEGWLEQKWYENGNKSHLLVDKSDGRLKQEWYESGVQNLNIFFNMDYNNGTTDEFKKEEVFYNVIRNEQGKVTKYKTYQALPINNGKQSCLYTYERKLSEGSKAYSKSLTSKSVGGRDGDYLIESKDIYESCIPVAYQACKEGKNSKSCEKLFMQGKYSKEHAYKNDYIKKLKIADRKFVEAKVNKEVDTKAHILKKYGYSKPNVYNYSSLTFKDRKFAYYGDNLVTGIAFGDRYTGGGLESFVTYKNGVRDGDNWFFYSNGRPKEFRNYKNGLVQGQLIVWDPYGYLVDKYNYKNNLKQGESRQYYNKLNFAHIQANRLADSGNPALINETDILSGKWSKTINKYYSKALPLEVIINYEDDKESGKSSNFWPNGELFMETDWSGGIRTDIVFYEPWKIDSKTQKKKVFQSHDVRTFFGGVGAQLRKTDNLNLINRTREFLHESYLAGKDPSFMRLLKANLAAKGETIIVTSKLRTNSGTRTNITSYGAAGIPDDLLQNSGRKIVLIDNNQVKCSVRLEEKGLNQLILVKMEEDFTDKNNIDNIASKCNQVREAYHSIQRQEVKLCSTSPSTCKRDIRAHYPVPKNIGQGITILAYPSLAFSSPSPLSPYYDNSCVDSEEKFCYRGVYESPSLFKNQYIDTTNWMVIPKTKAKLYQNSNLIKSKVKPLVSKPKKQLKKVPAPKPKPKKQLDLSNDICPEAKGKEFTRNYNNKYIKDTKLNNLTRGLFNNSLYKDNGEIIDLYGDNNKDYVAFLKSWKDYDISPNVKTLPWTDIYLDKGFFSSAWKEIKSDKNYTGWINTTSEDEEYKVDFYYDNGKPIRRLEYYKSGVLKGDYSANFKNDLKLHMNTYNGPFIEYSENGNISSISLWRNGVRYLPWVKRFENGQLKQEDMNWEKNDGNRYWDHVVGYRTNYYSNGRIKEQTNHFTGTTTANPHVVNCKEEGA